MYRVPTFSRPAPGSEQAVALPNSSVSNVKAFANNNQGNVAMTFGLMIFVMIGFVGSSVDVGRMLLARKQTQEAIDSAVLAGMKAYQNSTSGSSATDAINAAQVNYKFAVEQSGRGTPATNTLIATDTIAFVLQNNNTQMTATGDVTIKTPFIGVATNAFSRGGNMIGTLPVLKTDGSENAIAKVAIGSNAGTNLEVSVMIDITGSMCESESTVGQGRCGSQGSQKIDVVKTAAKNLVSILVWPDQSTYTSRVALVPFSEAVNLGNTTAATVARGAFLPGSSTTPGSQNYQVGNYYYPISSTCVTERLGSNAFTDSSPVSSPVGRYYSPYNRAKNTTVSQDGSCPTQTPLIPLSNNTATLNSTIDSLSAGGGTAGQMGTAWAWYALSPNFSSIWPNNTPARPYSDLTALTAKGKPVLRKIAILLTDGDYNTQYCNGVRDDVVGCNPNDGSSQSQADALCSGMKAKGIEVYTIGAMVSDNAKAFLTSCATDSHHYYDATNSAQITQAFMDIAYKLVPPYLSH
jgi:Flp pilus assembly protein TadG